MPLALVLRFSEGRSLTVDLSSVPCERLARELLSALASLCECGSRINSPKTAQWTVVVLHQFLRFLSKQYPETYTTYSVAQLCKEEIDAFEDHVRAQASRETSTTPYQKMLNIISLLREWMKLHPDSISDSLRERLGYIANGPIGISQPRDGYSQLIADTIRAACKEEITRIIHRITVQGEELLAQGQDPEVDGSDKLQNVLWFIARHGKAPSIKRVNPDRRVKPELRWQPLHELLYPSQRDLVPFFILLALSTDIAIESLKDLKVDCLKNETEDTVEISYLKRRAHNNAWQSLRVSDKGRWTPGGLIRLVMAITKRAHKHLQTEALWVGYWGRPRIVKFEAKRRSVHMTNVTKFGATMICAMSKGHLWNSTSIVFVRPGVKNAI
jgi:hypothetical protein